MEQLQHCSLLSAVHRNVIRKRQVLRSTELSDFWKILKIPGIPAGIFRDRRFPGIPDPGIPEWEFPMALLVR